jgi:hypothetical protein
MGFNFVYTTLCLVFGIVVYGSTFHTAAEKQVATFFGFAPDGHLMRNTGVLLILTGVVSVSPVRVIRTTVTTSVFVHYIVEAFLFR